MFKLHFVKSRDSDEAVVRFAIMASTVDMAVERGKKLLAEQTDVRPSVTGFIVMDHCKTQCARFYVTNTGVRI